MVHPGFEIDIPGLIRLNSGRCPMNRDYKIIGGVVMITATVLLLLALSPVLFRKRTIPLFSAGRIVAAATRPTWPWPWEDGQSTVYLDHSPLFSMWTDFFDFPLFIYTFADTRRFLCVYDDDTDVLVWVVDFNPGATPAQPGGIWPADNYLREVLTRRATNVVFNTTGLVRLPSQAEVQEASSNLQSLSPRQFRAESFPSADLGFYRSYWSKEDLLSDLVTNRTSVW